VELVGERNEETAQLFGEGPADSQAAQTVLLATDAAPVQTSIQLPEQAAMEDANTEAKAASVQAADAGLAELLQVASR
jgi:hypothetical protein